MKVKSVKLSVQRHTPGAFWLRNINGTSSIGGSAVPRAFKGREKFVCTVGI